MRHLFHAALLAAGLVLGVLNAGQAPGLRVAAALEPGCPETPSMPPATRTRLETPVPAPDPTSFDTTRLRFAETLSRLAQHDQRRDLRRLRGQLARMARLAPLETAQQIIEAAPRHQQVLLADLAHEWFAADGVRVLEMLRSADRFEKLRAFYHPLFAQVANEQPWTVVEPALALPDARLRQQILVNVAYACSAEELPRLLALLGARPAEERDYVVHHAADALAELDHEAVLAWAATVPPATQRLLRSAAINAMSTRAPRKALALALSGESNHREHVLRQSMEALAKESPEEALAVLELQADRRTQAAMMRGIAHGWGQSEPESAARWLAGLEHLDTRRQLSYLAGSWAQSDLESAAAFHQELDGERAGSWLHAVAGVLRAQDTPRLQSWVGSLRGSPHYPAMATKLVAWLHAEEPARAIEFTRSLGPEEADPVLGRLVMDHAPLAPYEAAGWLADLEDDARRADAARKVTSSAVERDGLRAVISWTQDLPPGTGRDAMLHALATSYGGETQALADGIDDPQLRVTTRLALRAQMPIRWARKTVAILETLALDDAQWEALERLPGTTGRY